MIEWHLEKRKIKDLTPYPTNPRGMSKEKAQQLEGNIKYFGLIDKPSINLDNMLIGGHQRIEILKKMKESEVEVWVPSKLLSEGEVQELNLTLNSIHGSFDYDILANEYDLMDLLSWGFTAKELDFLEEEKEKKEPNKTKRCPSCGHQW